MPSVISAFRNLRIRTKLLISYSTVFFLAMSMGSIVIYSFVRRTIEANIESELKNTTNAILNMVHTSATTSIKNHLRAIAEKNRDIAAYFYQQYQNGTLSDSQAKSRAAAVLLSQQIGKTGYIYCLSSKGIIKVHPKEALHGVDLSPNAFIQDQKARKDGYLQYDWRNPGERQTRAKALYMVYFAPWDWIISASSYRDEFNELIKVDDFRESILSMQFGITGYSYVLDSKGNLIVHPQLEGRNYYDARSAQGTHFIRDMCERKSGKIVYAWKNPGESAPRQKLVIFNYIPDFDWIVASSSYLTEFYAPLETIREIFLTTVLAFMVLVLPLTLRISSSITNPLAELTQKLAHGVRGGTKVRMTKETNDEIGQLARYFNTFMERLDTYSQNLKSEIKSSRRASREMARMRRYLKSIVDAMPSAMVAIDGQERVSLWNKEAETLSGLSEKEALGRPLSTVYHRIADQMELVRKAISSRQACKREKVPLMEGDVQRHMDIIAFPLTGKNTQGAVIRMDDVTARVRMEEIMVQTEKMMSVGGLAAGMAHEINNPVGAILQMTQNITRRLSAELPLNETEAQACGTTLSVIRAYLERREILKFLDGIRQSGERAARTVANMLSFSRRSDARKTPIDLAELLERTISLAAHDYDLKKKYDFRSMRIEREFAADMPPVCCSANEIEQVILNLLRNAAQAAGDDPCITLRLQTENEMALIEVLDNGKGMQEEIRKRVFEPFFTTKDVGAGTGLGLSVSYFIVTNNHGGSMTVASAPGQGTRFSIRIPLQPVQTLRQT